MKWPADLEKTVIGQPNSIISGDDLEDEVTEGYDDTPFKEIDTKLLPIDWVFRSRDGKKASFIDFLLKLKGVNNDGVYALEFTGALIEYIWDYYSK